MAALGHSTTVADETTNTTGTAASGEAWTQFQYNRQHSGYVPQNTPPQSAVEEQWKLEVSGQIDAPPVLGGGTLFVATDRYVYAIEPGTGEIVWNTTLYHDGRQAIVLASPSYAAGRVYLHVGNGDVFALDAATGERVWTRTFDGFSSRSAVTVVGETLYVGEATADGNGLFVLYATNGTTKYRSESGFGPFDITTIDSTPAVANGQAFFNADSRLFALSTTGTLEWKIFGDYDDVTASSPAVVDGTVYGIDGLGGVFAYDTATGDERWNYTGLTIGEPRTASPTIAHGNVYVAGANGVTALDAQTGDPLWNFSRRVTSYAYSPAVAGDGHSVFVTDSSETVFALNSTTGSVEWRYATDNQASNPVIIANRTLYLASLDAATTEGSSVTALSDTVSDDEARLTVGQQYDTNGNERLW